VDEGPAPVDEWPLGARVQRVDTPTESQVVLGLRWRTDEGHARGHLVLEPSGPALVDERPRGAPVDGFGKRLRNLLEGARLVAVERRGAAWRLGLDRGRDASRLWLTHEKGSPVGRDADGRPLAGRHRLAAEPWGDGWAPAEAGPRRALAAPQRAASPLRVAGRARVRSLRRTCAKIRREIARADEAAELRQRGDLLKAHLHAWKPGADRVQVTDFYADPPAEREVPVDPALGPSATADGLFHRARRFERGAEVGAKRVSELERQVAALEAWLAAEPEDSEERSEWEDAGARLGLATSAPKAGSRKPQPTRSPYRRFLAAGDRPVLVGRGARDNDELTLRVARPWDLWLHAKARRGAHVVVPLEKKEPCPPELLADAAMLAAHFSEAHGDAIVEVSYVPRRHVHKRKGDAPGAVRPSREKIFAVRMDSARLRALLEREVR